MPVEDNLRRLALERKRSVNQLARTWGENGVSRSPETPKMDFPRPELAGRQLISRLLCSAQDLEGRVVGRHKDDASFLCKGLEVLLQEWEILETTSQEAQQMLDQYEGRRQANVLLSSPESSDTRYASRQQDRIQQLEQQEERLLSELRDIKTQWEAIMAKTMEHQASIHRQQMREREVLVAQKDAELENLRQRVNASRPSQALRGDQQSPRRQQLQQQRQQQPALRPEPEQIDQTPPRQPEKYLMTGRMVVGQTLQIIGPTDENARDKYQWYQVDSRGDWFPISGATRNQYSPEPDDQGIAIGCVLTPSNASGNVDVKRISSRRPVMLPQDLEDWVASLMEEGGACFGVVVVQKNGMLHTNREVCTLDITPHNLQLRLPNDLMLQQPYTASMQVCGARGAGSAAAQGVFLAMRPHEIYMLACETPRERNACILLIRKMAALHNLRLKGP